ncbi:MAG: hypothetical protein ACLGG7_10475 [Bacteriovoracia bacterium]
MALQDTLSGCDIEMDAREVEAFFIGCLTADDPMPYPKAIKELFLEETKVPVSFTSPDARKLLEKDLSALWKELEKGLDKRRKNLLVIDRKDLKEEMVAVGRLGDFFLMGLTLAGMSVDDEDSEVGELLDEMEDHLLLMDEWVADGVDRLDQDVWLEEGRKYRRELSELWSELQDALDV